jgi:hypothetical protein
MSCWIPHDFAVWQLTFYTPQSFYLYTPQSFYRLQFMNIASDRMMSVRKCIYGKTNSSYTVIR